MDWISRWSAESPAHPALVEAERGRVTSYAELDERASRLAAVLQRGCGIEPGDRVAALLRDRRELVELCFACRRSGAIFAPLGHDLARAEVAALLRDCRPAVLVHDGRWRGPASIGPELELGPTARARASAHECARIVVGQVNGDGALSYELALANAGRHSPVPVKLDDIAMILYPRCAGSRAKGVMLPWRQVEFNADITVERFALSNDDRGVSGLELSDTIGLNGLTLPLLRCGGTVILWRDGDTSRLPAALELGPTSSRTRAWPHLLSSFELERQRVTVVVAGPEFYGQLLVAGLGEVDLARLRYLLVVGGERCPDRLIAAYSECGLRLRRGYGRAEVGPNCFTFAPEDRPGSVGKPVPGTRARLVAGDDSRVAVGAVGELWLSGPHVSAGYWGQARRSARRLSAGGWFRTGDCAWQDEEGCYYVVGCDAGINDEHVRPGACGRRADHACR